MSQNEMSQNLSQVLSTQEVEEVNKLKEIGNLALREAYETVRRLAQFGISPVKTNQFGDTALRGDVEAESAVLEVLKANNIPIKVISEEHGVTIIGDNPLYLGILDGIDGSGVYRRERDKGRYGTMFAIYKTTDPTFNDYLYGGIMEHVSNRLCFASKGKGSLTVENGEAKPIHCSQSLRLDRESSKLYADTNFDKVYKTNVISDCLWGLGGYNIACMSSSAVHYVDLASGYVDGVIECTRKGNLEIAVAFPLITEAGGVLLGVDGISLGDRKYTVFGQNNHEPVISACTLELGKDMLRIINR